MLVCFVLALVSAVVFRLVGSSLSWGIAVAMSVPTFLGIVKEIDDSGEEGHFFDWKNIRDNEIGACVGTALGCLMWL